MHLPKIPCATVENAAGSSTPGCEPFFLTVTIASGGMVTLLTTIQADTSTAGTPADGPSGAWDSSLEVVNHTQLIDVGEYPYYCAGIWMEGLVIVTDDHSCNI